METLSSPAVTQIVIEVLPDGRVLPDQAAIFLDKTPATLKTWRRRGVGPEYEREGRNVYYRLPKLQAFVAKRTKPGR